MCSHAKKDDNGSRNVGNPIEIESIRILVSKSSERVLGDVEIGEDVFVFGLEGSISGVVLPSPAKNIKYPKYPKIGFYTCESRQRRVGQYLTGAHNG